ncbi:hypothetical protein, partial [Calidifontibacter indicus]|uniref:hypothetical protein n=1 Tax=Calidifontibacter indicus TaxID=419650 RepID=UPI003D72629C
ARPANPEETNRSLRTQQRADTQPDTNPTLSTTPFIINKQGSYSRRAGTQPGTMIDVPPLSNPHHTLGDEKACAP